MKTKGIVTEADYHRLLELVHSFRSENSAEYIRQLWQELKSFRLLPSKNVPPDVVTMNSQVLIKNIASGEEMVVTLVYPKDADIVERKVSVIAPIGIALIGNKEGDVVVCRGPSGGISYELVKVVYQPERFGDMHL
jgi:regulator of nucleoside diphosphate kinase